MAAERPRDRIWELAETLHCSIVGTCLSTADGRSLLAKLGVAAAKPDDTLRETVKGLEARLARERAHTEALEEKAAVLMCAMAKLSLDLETETAQRRAAETELAAVESLIVDDRGHERSDAGRDESRLTGRTLLYVGGRPRQVARLRRFVEQQNGRMLSYDGGIEDNLTLLPGLVSRSDLVLFPVECVSHEATDLVKRYCEAGSTACRPSAAPVWRASSTP
ncbi:MULTISPECIES: DUF2325 domain-containing protein [Methylobacteriaceae]|uniref:DUF2325 domain-containing protein n=1 Tax=Methylobacteriaceae TaxID=119045 RepID=UPI002F351FE4